MVRLYAVDDNDISTDISEAVKALYDLAVSSMDYGSGFWSYEDAAPVAALAELMGWDGAEGLRKYTDDELHKTEAQAWARDNGYLTFESWHEFGRVEKRRRDGSTLSFPSYKGKQHEHVFSTVGRCMWYQCKETAESVK